MKKAKKPAPPANGDIRSFFGGGPRPTAAAKKAPIAAVPSNQPPIVDVPAPVKKIKIEAEVPAPKTTNAIRTPFPERHNHLKEAKNVPAPLYDDRELWTDKYSPKSTSELVGNGPSIAAIKGWLKTWRAIHVDKTTPAPAWNKANPGSRAVLVSGPPGIGKTSAVRLIAAEMGFELFEMNASDNRSQKSIREILTNAVQVKMTLSGKPRVVVMEEVDGVSVNDRGGNAELVKIIKTTKVPIICTCNDRMKTSVRTLATNCFDVRFDRPMKQAIVARMEAIAKNEGVQIDKTVLMDLVTASGNDIRQVINTLYMSQGVKCALRGKDLSATPFEATKRIFNECKKTQVDDRLTLFFCDYSMVPLLVNHNAAPVCISSRSTDKLAVLDKLAATCDAVCDADVIDSRIHVDNSWSLLPDLGMACVRTGSIADGFVPFPAFPDILGKMSTTNKRKRLLVELSGKSHIPPSSMRLEYLEPMRSVVFGHLRADKVSAAVDFAQSCGLGRDDVMETLVSFVFGNADESEFKVSPKTKAAFTREFNRRLPPSTSATTATKGSKKSKSKSKSALGEDGEDDEDEDGGDGDDDAIQTKSNPNGYDR